MRAVFQAVAFAVLSISCVSAMSIHPIRPDESLMKSYYYDTQHATVMWKSGNATEVMAQNPGLLRAAGIMADNEGMQRSGWDTVYVEADPSFLKRNPAAAYYAIGFAEGAETQHRIYQNYMNLYPPYSNLTSQTTPRQLAWINYQREFVNNVSRAKMNTSDPSASFWAAVQNAHQQMQGLIDGYHAVVSDPAANEYLTDLQIYMVSFTFELSDVQFWDNTTAPPMPANNATVQPTPSNQSSEVHTRLAPKRRDGRGFRKLHCSALVKVTANDLLMAQDTWSGYSTMLRQFKTYKTETTVTFSSYPGTLHSGDDWYMMDSGLTSQETTLEYNPSPANSALALAQGIRKDSVPEFMRVMIANRLATSAPEWGMLFCQNNSGTYNNEYMIVDMNLFNATGGSAAERLPTGTFQVVEQMPGLCVSQDQTSVLRHEGYWASYNLPAFPQVNDYSGNAYQVQQYGNFFSHTFNNRAQIFRRNQSMVTDVDSMMALMRYNNFRHDNLSHILNCSTCPNNTCTPAYSAALSIASRFDANTNGNQSTLGPLYEYFDFGAFGAIDSKIISWSRLSTMNASVISGPTVQPASNLAPFSWTMFPEFASVMRLGIPDTFNFEVMHPAKLYSPPPATAAPATTSTENRYWIIAVTFGFIAICIVFTVMYKRRVASQPSGKGETEPLAKAKYNAV